MKQSQLKAFTDYVENNISTFHEKRIKSLDNLKLSQVLKRKNPYLFKAKHMLTAEQIIKGLIDAHLSSHEETIFGDWLEEFAIFVSKITSQGRKSGIKGIDLEFDREGIRYIIAIKSGPNWGNSSQIAKMIIDFSSAKKSLKTTNSKLNVIAVNGCCYGKDSETLKNADYYKYCGQKFWEFISGDKNLYTEIIEPLGHKAKENNENFIESYAKMINKFTKQFTAEFCDDNGNIAWEELVKFNSSAK